MNRYRNYIIGFFICALGATLAASLFLTPAQQPPVAPANTTPEVVEAAQTILFPDIIGSFDFPYGMKPDLYERHSFYIADYDFSEDFTKLYLPWSPAPDDASPSSQAFIYVYDISNPKNVRIIADIGIGMVIPEQVVVRGKYLFILQRINTTERDIAIYETDGKGALRQRSVITNFNMPAFGVSSDGQWVVPGQQITVRPPYKGYYIADIDHPYAANMPGVTDPYIYRLIGYKVYPYSKKSTLEDWKKPIPVEEIDLSLQTRFHAKMFANRVDNTIATYDPGKTWYQSSDSEYTVNLWDVSAPEKPVKAKTLTLHYMPPVSEIRVLPKAHALFVEAYGHVVFYSLDNSIAINCTNANDPAFGPLCKDRDFAVADGIMAGLYQYVLYSAAPEQQKMYFDDEADWLRQKRDLCSPKTNVYFQTQLACWKREYNNRTIVLDKVLDDYLMAKLDERAPADALKPRPTLDKEKPLRLTPRPTPIRR